MTEYAVNYVLNRHGVLHYDAWVDHFPNEAVPILHWCVINSIQNWRTRGGVFYFESEIDATMFAMRWL